MRNKDNEEIESLSTQSEGVEGDDDVHGRGIGEGTLPAISTCKLQQCH